MRIKKLFDKRYKKKYGIWNCIQQESEQSSQTDYDQMHAKTFSTIYDGSYEVLGQFSKGNLTLDVACGDGYLTKLSPDTIVGLDFSLNALKKAKANGAKHLVLADAHKLPFKDLSFELCICSGSLEHFRDPLMTLKEMYRVSKTQIIITHRPYPIPFANSIRKLILNTLKLPDQPQDNPLTLKEVSHLCAKSGMYIVYSGYWSYPYNLEIISSFIPRIFYQPSCSFIVTTHPPHSLDR